MRTTADRIRHTVLFELIGLTTSAPLAAWILDKELVRLGTLSVAMSLLAMGMNYIFNLVFDLALIRLGRPVNVRPLWMRVLHAVLFEVSLIVIAIPLVAWWLDMTLWAALLTDVGYAAYYLVYAFVFNWTYDLVFPMPVEVAVAEQGTFQ